MVEVHTCMIVEDLILQLFSKKLSAHKPCRVHRYLCVAGPLHWPSSHHSGRGCASRQLSAAASGQD